MAKKQAARAAAPVEAEVLPAEIPDVALAATDGQQITGFLSNLVPFFRTATQLEVSAKRRLEEAQALELRARTIPLDRESDEQMQRFCKTLTTEKKAIEDHWTITSVVSQFHRRMTAARKRAIDPLDGASLIANNLHNRYTEQERRRAAEEQERIRQEQERIARENRERELAAAEQQAVDAEAHSAELSERESKFVRLVNVQMAPVHAARQCGYADPVKQAARLMDSPKVKAALQGLEDARNIRQQAESIRTAPLDVRVEEVRPNISRGGGGGYDRTTHAAELLDEAALIDAVLSGKHGIPRDVLRVDPSKLNEYARSLHERIELWPGVRYKKTTKVV